MAIVALVALLIALGVGRLMMGPVTTSKLTPWIENVLSQKQYGLSAKVGQSLLHWDSSQGKIVLDLTGVQFVDALEQKVADIPQVLLMLSPMGYFEKEHSPWIMVVRHPQVHLRIDQQNKLRLGALQAGESNILERDEETQLTSDGLRQNLKRLAASARGAAFGLFSNFTIEDAGVTLIDEPHNEVWNFTVPLLSMKRMGRDQEGSARLHVKKEKIETDVDFNLRYSNAEKLFHAVLSFKDIDPTMFSIASLSFKIVDYSTAQVSGAVTLVFDDELEVRNGLLNLVLGAGAISVPQYFKDPLKMKGATLAAAYTSSNKTLTLEPATIELEKATLGASVKLLLSGDAKTITGQVKLSNLRLENLPMYWPEGVALNPRAWILENMKKGLAEEVTANIDVSIPGDDWNFDNAKLDRLDGTISLKETQVRYWEPLPMIENASATSKYDIHHFDIDVLGGEVGSVKLKPSHVTISGLDAADQIATIEAHLAGPAQETLRILNRPPLGYADKMHVDPGLVSGSMEGVIKTSFPLIKALLLDDMGISAEVKLINVGVKKIVDFLQITDANATLGVDAKALSIDGEAKLNGIQAHIRWDEKFSAAAGEALSHGAAHATTPVESAAKFGVGFSIHSDPVPVTVVYDRYPDLSKLAVTADAGKAELDIPDVGYYKKPGAPAVLQVGLEWGGGPPPRLSKIDMSGQNLNVKGSGAFGPGGKTLASLKLDPLVIGQTRAKLDFIRENGIPHWTLTGDSLDIQGFLNAPVDEKKVTDEIAGKEPEDEAVTPLRVDVQVNRLIAGEKAELGNTSIKGVRDIYGWSTLNVATVAAEETPFNLSIAPQGNRTVLAANTPNLSNVLKSMNVTDTMTGGKLTMDGKSEPNDVMRSLFGHIKLTEFRVKNMPVVVKLLSAISPDALVILSQQSLHFGELSSEYIWNKNSFIFTKANTSTGTLGLTAAGKVDLVHNKIDLEGQVIPVEFISKIIGAIPLIGDILTGGDGHGLFAATYKVKGPLSKPDVSVNPVSILAPGIIRDILFTNPNITKDAPVKVPEAAPVLAPAKKR
jgi:hypothetical protein